MTEAPAMKQRRISERKEREGERALFRAVLALGTVDEARAFFRDLCTPAELEALADRWAVVEALGEGLSYREVHARTGVSVTTVGRVSRYLERGHGGYALVARRLTGGEA
jgi:TrpR-related protein YerC/YecD